LQDTEEERVTHSRLVLLVGIHLSLSTVGEPLELPLSSSDLLGLDVVPGGLLLLGSDLGVDFRLVTTSGRSSRSGSSSGSNSRSDPRGDGGGGGRSSRGGRRSSILEGVLDETDLSDVGESSSIDVPDLREEDVEKRRWSQNPREKEDDECERRNEKRRRRLTSGQRALTNSMLCEIMQTAPPQSRIATERPPRASRSKLKVRKETRRESQLESIESREAQRSMKTHKLVGSSRMRT